MQYYLFTVHQVPHLFLNVSYFLYILILVDTDVSMFPYYTFFLDYQSIMFDVAFLFEHFLAQHFFS